MSRLIMSVVAVAMGGDQQQTSGSGSDSGSNSGSNSDSLVSNIFFFKNKVKFSLRLFAYELFRSIFVAVFPLPSLFPCFCMKKITR